MRGWARFARQRQLPARVIRDVLARSGVVLVLRAQPGTRTPTRNAASMTAPIFDHDRLDVYRLSIEYVAASFAVAKDLGGLSSACARSVASRRAINSPKHR